MSHLRCITSQPPSMDAPRSAENILNYCTLDGFILSTAGILSPIDPSVLETTDTQPMNTNDHISQSITSKLLDTNSKSRSNFIVYINDNIYIGVLVTPSNNYDNCHDKFIEVFEQIDATSVSLTYYLQMNHHNNINSINKNKFNTQVPLEVSAQDIVKSNETPNSPTVIHIIKPSSVLPRGGVIVYVTSSLQVAKCHTNTALSLILSLQLSSHSQENKSIRNILEEYRYQSHSEPIREIPVNIVIRNALQVKSTSIEDKSSCSSIWTITVENSQKLNSLLLGDVSIDLKSSIRMEHRHQSRNGEFEGDDGNMTGGSCVESIADSALYSEYSEDMDDLLFNYTLPDGDSLDDMFTIKPLLPLCSVTNTFPMIISAGESYTFAYVISMNDSNLYQGSFTDLVAKYLTPLSIWWCSIDSTTAQTLTNEPKVSIDHSYFVPYQGRVLWSTNCDFMERTSKNALLDPNAAMNDDYDVSDIIVSMVIPYGPLKVNLCYEIIITLENTSTTMIHHQLTIRQSPSAILRGFNRYGTWYGI